MTTQEQTRVVAIAEWLTSLGNDVHRAGRLQIGNQVYDEAVSYSNEHTTFIYILGDPLPSHLAESPTIDDGDNAWYFASYSPETIKPEHEQYYPFGRFFQLFQASEPMTNNRGNVRGTRNLQWLTPR